MLIYHPAYDAYHCAFRLLILTEKLRRVDLARLRIIDFYFAFPAEIRKIRLPRTNTGIRKVAEELHNIYHGPLHPLQTFREMKHLQLAALRTLAAASIVDPQLLDKGVVNRLDTLLPEIMSSTMDNFNEAERELFDFITGELFDWPLNGVDGLKDRTGLLEFRYDNA